MTLKMIVRFYTLCIIVFTLPTQLFSETIGVFFDANVEQIKFAAGDVKSALEAKNFTVEMLPLASLNASYANKKVVVALADDNATSGILTTQGGTLPTDLKEQGYGLRTTINPQQTFWVLGADVNGAMYGGLQIAENINFSGFSGSYNSQETPAMLKRGIKLNLPMDKEAPTYGKSNHGGFEGTSYSVAIPHVWDATFWHTWFDEMARNRYNVISIWMCHPFTSLIKMADYPDVAIQNVTGFNGFFKAMTIDEKIVFWKEIMSYAKSRGFDFYFFNWNVFTYGATGKYGITEQADNPTTVTYMYKCTKTLFETYPDLDGFGVTNGENGSNQDFLWEAYGKAIYDYALANPQRNINFIHRWHWTTLPEIKTRFAPLFTLANVKFDMSYKYSVAHMYSAPTPGYYNNDNIGQQLTDNNMKSWLTVRNDEIYYHQWGDPTFARAYVNSMINLGSNISGFYMGHDGYCPTRTFFSKDAISQNQLEIQRQWFMYKLWGRLSYNPNTPDDVFKNFVKLKFPTVSADNLYDAWIKASRCLPKVTELVHGSWGIDLNWYLEACNSRGSFRNAQVFSDCNVASGSTVCNFGNTADNKCNGKKSTLDNADEIENDALSALTIVGGMQAERNTELGVTLNSIRAMSYMSLFYAYKIRGATYIRMGAGKNSEKIEALGKSYCWWIKYTNLMDSLYTGMGMQRVDDIPNWHYYDASVLKDYTDNGGIGMPNCTGTPQTPFADFKANVATIAPGESVRFTDQSFNTPTSWLWTFEGGTPAISTEQHPTVSYATLGTYPVTLTASNGIGNSTLTKAGFVTVTNNLPVTILADWISGNTINKVSANNRLLTVLVMGESTGDFTATNVTYGGEAMIKQVEKMQTDGSRSYIGIFTLNEAGIKAATTETITVTWSATPSSGNSIYSAFFGNVDQATPVVANASNGLTGTTLITSALAAASNEMVLMCGATANNNTVVFNNGFLKQFEANPTWGDGIGGIKMGSGVSETPSFTQSASGRMALCAVVVKNVAAPTSVNCIKELGHVKIYPIPASNLINIDFSASGANKEIKIYNILGEVVHQLQTKNAHVQLNVKSLNLSGAVLIQIIEGNTVSNHRVLMLM